MGSGSCKCHINNHSNDGEDRPKLKNFQLGMCRLKVVCVDFKFQVVVKILS